MPQVTYIHYIEAWIYFRNPILAVSPINLLSPSVTNSPQGLKTNIKWRGNKQKKKKTWERRDYDAVENDSLAKTI